MTRWFTTAGELQGLTPSERGFAYGDGLFETVAVRDGRPGWQRHVERLRKGCERLGLMYPGDALLSGILSKVLDEQRPSRSDCIVKIILTAGDGARGYARTPDFSPGLYAAAFDAPTYPASADVRVCRTRLARQPLLAGMKTLNRLEQVLARQELDGEFEGLMCDDEDRIICGTMSNVFLVHGASILTPSLDLCGVAGVARAELLDRATASGISIDVTHVPLDLLSTCTTLLLVNSQFGVMPVHRIDGRRIDSDCGVLAPLLADAGFGGEAL